MSNGPALKIGPDGAAGAPPSAFEAAAGASDSTPKRPFSPSTVPAGITALLPTNVRRPIRIGASVSHPSSTRAALRDTSSAIVAPSSIVTRSGAVRLAVESSTKRPIFAPSARYHGLRYTVA